MFFCLSSLLQLGAATFFSSFRPRWIQQRQLSLLQRPVQSGVAPMKLKIRRRLDWGFVLSSSVLIVEGNQRFCINRRRL